MLAACQLALGATGTSKASSPILANFLATVENNTLTLTATDTEFGVHLKVRGELMVTEPGAALWPAARLVSILREQTSDSVEIESDNDSTRVTADRTEYEMPGESPDAYPLFPCEVKSQHTLDAAALVSAIDRTIFAVANENARYAATKGVAWDAQEGVMRLVGTDGRRLAQVDIPAPETKQGNGLSVVPAKAMKLLEKVIAGATDPVQVELRANEALFRCGDTTVYSRLVDGRFPDYAKVMPKNNPNRVEVVVAEFARALRQAAIMVDDESCRVMFTFDKGKLTLCGKASARGKSRVQMPLEWAKGALEISFDPNFILPMLRTQEPDTRLILELKGTGNPALLRNESGEYKYVVVPVVVKTPETEKAKAAEPVEEEVMA